MEVQEFVDSRKKELEDFQKNYTFLRQEYSSVLSSAIQEQDSAQQQTLIQQVLQINSSMVEAIREILKVLNRGQDSFDPVTIDKLTADLIQYQKDYAEIEQTKDKVGTLKMIIAEKSKNLKDATTMYYVYLAILIVLCFVVAYLVIRTGWVSQVTSTATRMIIPRQ